MLIAGILFDIGVVITCAAFNLPMLYLGRIFLGIAVAFASVAVTLYNSEMAPAHIRGRLNQIFQVGPSLMHLPSSLQRHSLTPDLYKYSRQKDMPDQYSLLVR